MIIQDDTLELKGEGYTVEPYGAGIADGDADSRSSSTAVQAFIDDGRWPRRTTKWIGQYTAKPIPRR